MPQTECDSIANGLMGDTIEFLSRNIVMTATSAESRPSNTRVRNFDFTSRDITENTTVFELIVGDGNNIINGLMQVCFLPWGVDSGYHIILERNGGPDIMLTAQMGGCSVGYIRAEDGTIRVSHHNLQSSRGNMDQAQRQTLSFAGQNVVHPGDYYYNNTSTIDHIDSGESSTLDEIGNALVYGVRKPDGWHMFKQFIKRTLRRNNFNLDDRSDSWIIVSVREF